MCCCGVLRWPTEPKNCVILYMLKMYIGFIYVRYEEEGVGGKEKTAYNYSKLKYLLLLKGLTTNITKFEKLRTFVLFLPVFSTQGEHRLINI